MVNTLLEILLAANPSTARGPDVNAEPYTPGENILPRIERPRRTGRRSRAAEGGPNPAPDRPIQETRERRQPDLQVPSSRRSRSRSAGQEVRHESDQRRHVLRPEQGVARETGESVRHERSPSVDPRTDRPARSPPRDSPRHPDAVEARRRAGTVAQQPSLISLASASNGSTGTGDSISQAQVVQDIVAEGLLDGINPDNLTEAEQAALIVRIAERLRELHPEGVPRARDDPRSVDTAVAESIVANMPVSSSRSEHSSSAAPASATPSGRRDDQTRAERNPRHITTPPDNSRSLSLQQSRTAESAPTARSRNLSPPQQPRHHRRRASDQDRNPDGLSARTSHSTPSAQAPAARSATDLSTRPRASSRTTTDSLGAQANGARVPTDPLLPPSVQWQAQSGGRQPMTIQTIASEQLLQAREIQPPSRPAPPVPSPAPARFEEPSISCARCSRSDIQYEIHKHCSPCKMDLCLGCFRADRGCDHWYGFGHAAMIKFEASHPTGRNSQPLELPHKLAGRQYQRPSQDSIMGPRNEDNSNRRTRKVITTSDPSSRLREGQFCDVCGTFANDCFWACDTCNSGEWGFCKTCVNTHHCCSHPLLSLKHKSLVNDQPSSPPHASNIHSGQDSLYPPNAMMNHMSRLSPVHSAASSATSMSDFSAGPIPDFVRLTIRTDCDICHQHIPESLSRYHCPSHPSPAPSAPEAKGDYDICSQCYHRLVKTGQIRPEDGPSGWRLCPAGHRMIVTIYEADYDGNQTRVVLHDLVGGVQMTADDIVAWKAAAAASSPTTINVPDPPPSAMPSQASKSRGEWIWREDSTSSNRRTRVRRSTVGIASNMSNMTNATGTVVSSSTAASDTTGTTRFPPDGGLGRRCRARYSWYPEPGEGGKGELMFPKYADVAEVEEVNEEWWFGVYAGSSGVFPRVYVQEILPGNSMGSMLGSNVGSNVSTR